MKVPVFILSFLLLAGCNTTQRPQTYDPSEVGEVAGYDIPTERDCRSVPGQAYFVQSKGYRHVSTTNIDIFYDQVSDTEIEKLRTVAEQSYEFVRGMLGLRNAPRVTIVAQEEPKESFPRASTEWCLVILPALNGSIEKVITSVAHEIAHALAGSPYGMNIVMAEGLAVYIAGTMTGAGSSTMRNHQLHTFSFAVNQKYRMNFSLEFLLRNREVFSQEPDYDGAEVKNYAAYIYSGSFVRYLVEKFGWAAVLEVYYNGEFARLGRLEFLGHASLWRQHVGLPAITQPPRERIREFDASLSSYRAIWERPFVPHNFRAEKDRDLCIKAYKERTTADGKLTQAASHAQRELEWRKIPVGNCRIILRSIPSSGNDQTTSPDGVCYDKTAGRAYRRGECFGGDVPLSRLELAVGRIFEEPLPDPFHEFNAVRVSGWESKKLCAFALHNVGNSGWASNRAFQIFVAEALKRRLSPSLCRELAEGQELPPPIQGIKIPALNTAALN